jgi:hypothetical protein
LSVGRRGGRGGDGDQEAARVVQLWDWLRGGTARWALAVGALTALASALPFVALTRPPVDPVVTIANTGDGGLALLTDTAGRRLVIGGSAARTEATTPVDRLLPPWERRLSLLLAPPPHARLLPGALTLRERRPAAEARLLGLAAEPDPAIDAWQASRPDPPVVGTARVALGAETWLTLETGPEPAAGAALALVERGPVRLLLLFGAAEALAGDLAARGQLATPAVVAQMSSEAGPLPAALRPGLVIRTARAAAGAGAPRQLTLAPGESVRIVVRADRLVVEGEPVSAQP